MIKRIMSFTRNRYDVQIGKKGGIYIATAIQKYNRRVYYCKSADCQRLVEYLLMLTNAKADFYVDDLVDFKSLIWDRNGNWKRKAYGKKENRK